jgi:hypothetical protein
MLACCVQRQRFLFRDCCCMICALASCWWCPPPCGGPLIGARCGRWCLHRVVRIANICCWFLVCVCVVLEICECFCRGICLACVHRVPCVWCVRVCVTWLLLPCVCVRVWGACPVCILTRAHPPYCNTLYLFACSSSTVCVVVVGLSGCHHVTSGLLFALQHPCAAVCCCARTGPCTVTGLA